MRCGMMILILIIGTNLFLGYWMGCSVQQRKKVYVYEYYDYKRGSLHYMDTTEIIKQSDGVNKLCFYKGGLQNTISYINTSNEIKIFDETRCFVLYNRASHTRYDNLGVVNIFTPYLVPSTVFVSEKEYFVRGEKFSVYKFRTNLNSSDGGFAYFSDKFGFLAYVISPPVYKILKIARNIDSPEWSKVAIELTQKLIADSSFFYYPDSHKQKIIFKAPYRIKSSHK